MKRTVRTVIKAFMVDLVHYVFWVALLVTLWTYVFILNPQSGSMFRYVGF